MSSGKNIAKKDLENRDDVGRLVRTFYARVRKDEVLGPIFNGIITDWETHLEKLTDFWNGNLFFFVKTSKHQHATEFRPRNGAVQLMVI